MAFNSLADIKETAQRLDTAVVQWMNSGPPENVQVKLRQARELLQRGEELADAPLRIAVVGEFNSGKTLLLNALLDSTELFPCLLKPTTGNVSEVRVHLTRDERPAEIRQAAVSFFNQLELENVLEHYLKNLRSQGIDGVPAKVTINDLDRFEQFLLRKFGDLKSLTPKYSIISTLEFVVAVKYCSSIVKRETRHSCPLPVDLIPSALTLSERPELNKGIQAHHQQLKQMHESVKTKQGVDKITSTNLRALFPMIRRVEVDVDAWCVPFGVSDPEDHNTLAFLDFPGLGAESSSARDEYLCMSEIRDAHAVLVVFNGANPGTSGASVMASLFQRVGKLTSDRTLVAVNRFDEFEPLPTGSSVAEYYSRAEKGTTVGFSTILIPAKNMLASSKKLNLYVCSALCYLFDEKSKRPNWNFGVGKWFNDNRRQAAYTLYKRCYEDFSNLINNVGQNRAALQEHLLMREGLERYLDSGGIPTLRNDLVKFAVERGERLVKEDAMKEIRSAQQILDEIAPIEAENAERGISSEVSFCAQEFYRVLELAVADTLPSGPSDYKKLKLRAQEEDVVLWELIEAEIAASIACWPEWFAILNQTTNKPKNAAADKPKRGFGRYKHLKKAGGDVPEEFKAFDERFEKTAEELTGYTLECIQEAIRYSLQRFENHPDYRASIEQLQSVIDCQRLPEMEEALPLLDVWQPSQMADGEDGVIPIIVDRIDDEIEALKSMSYPYDGSKPCDWNLALIIRVQVQLVKTYRDRLSRLVAAAENNFQDFFCNEVLRAEILPLVRSSLNNTDFLGDVATAEAGSTWESVGQVVRRAVNEIRSQSVVSPLRPKVPASTHESRPRIVDEPDDPPASTSIPDEPEPTEETVRVNDSAPKIVDDGGEEFGEIIDEEEFEEW